MGFGQRVNKRNRFWLRTATIGAFLAGLSLADPIAWFSKAQAQPNTASEMNISIPPEVLATIREGPFSQVFPLADGQAYVVKDKDYNPAEPNIGVFSLWADVPVWERLQLVIKYCVPDTSLANASASLVNLTLMDGEVSLVTIDELIEASDAQLNEIRPPRTSNVQTSLYFDPFYGPYYYSPFRLGVSYSPSTYVPAVDCSGGLARFDLKPVIDEIAQLPDQTLRMRLLFSDGSTEYWRLGNGTVSAIKQLPSVTSAN